MSWQKSLLNLWLRLIEQRQMANAEGPSSMRRAFELEAKIMLHAERKWNGSILGPTLLCALVARGWIRRK
jgi:hypothetical protein